MRTSSAYRADIDGLRAIAVLSVVLYHLQAPGFGGGFAGVDVFFVISGFLIGGHIAAEIAQGRFSLAAFYERRVRRILPALFCMLALTLLAGGLVLFPPDVARLGPIAASVVAFVANLRIAQTLGGYAGAFAQTSPLLHTWSLAVEEQFYLVFPLLMLAIARLAARRYVPILAVLALMSFAACVVAARIEPHKAFYSAPFRAWELLLGALVAVGAPPPLRSGWMRDALALVGLALIAAADLLFNQDTPFPSEYALAPCVGAALILHADCNPRSLAGRLLVNPVSTRIGLWSYSLYLVHWPLLVFARAWLDASLSVPVRGLLLAASIGLAALSWRFVEQPFRGPHELFATHRLYGVAAGAAVVLLAAALALPRIDRGSDRDFPQLTAAQRTCWDLAPEVGARRASCSIGAPGAATSCAVGRLPRPRPHPGRGRRLHRPRPGRDDLLRGRMPAGARRRTQRAPRRPAAFAGLAAAFERRSAHCALRNDAVLRWIAAHRIPVAILAAHWIAYADTAKVPTAAADHLTLLDGGQPEPASEAAIFERNLAATLVALQRLGVRVFVVEDAPQQAVDVPIAVAARARLGLPAPPGISRAAYEAQQAVATGVFARLKGRYGFTLIRPQDILCAGGRCALTHAGQVFYQDDEHLSPQGAMAVVPAFEPVWRSTSLPGPAPSGGG